MSIPDFTSYGLVLKPVPQKAGWFCGPVIDWEQREEGEKLAARLRTSPAASQFQVMFGLLDEDQGYRIYVTPLVGVRELVEAFRVGEHGAQSYCMNAAKTIERTATRLEAIQKICPFTVIFVNNGALHAEFTRKLTESDASKIEDLFPIDDAIKDGLDGYVSEWDGEGSILAPRLLREQSIQIWWD